MKTDSAKRPDPTLSELWGTYLDTGDESAMEALVAGTRPRLLAAARRIVRGEGAEDAVQSAYLSLVRRGPQVRDVPVLPWLLTATVRLAYRCKARHRRDGELVERLGAPGRLTHASREELGSDETALIRRSVDELPDTYRDAVVLHYLNGLTTVETAQALGVTPGALRVRLHRARALLRERGLRRVAFGALLFPVTLCDRLRSWWRSGATGGLGVLSVPGMGAWTFTLLCASLGGGSWALSAAPQSLTTATEIEQEHSVALEREAETADGELLVRKRSAAAPTVLHAEGERFIVEDHDSTGQLRCRREVRILGGEQVDDGTYETWRADGTRSSLGKCAEGRRVGRWDSFHENGKLVESGVYVKGLESGLWTEWSESGQKVGEVHYREGVLQGVSRTWTPERSWRDSFKSPRGYRLTKPNETRSPPLREEGTYVDGEEHGAWKYYDVAGRLRLVKTFRDGAQHGVTTRYMEGVKFEDSPYDDDVIHGKVVRYDDAGRVMGTTDHVYGQVHGEQTWFHPNGQRANVTPYERDQVHGKAITWHPNGARSSEIMWDRGRPTGLSKRWHDNGQKAYEFSGRAGHSGRAVSWNAAGVKVSESTIEKGRLEGRARWWFDDGQLRSEGRYSQGRSVGTWRSFSPDGEAFEVVYERGVAKEGVRVFWAPSGERRRQTTFLNFKKHGLEMSWHDPKHLRHRVSWRNGLRDGPLEMWDAQGKLTYAATYRSGRLHGAARDYAPDGTVTDAKEYRDGKLVGAREGTSR